MSEFWMVREVSFDHVHQLLDQYALRWDARLKPLHTIHAQCIGNAGSQALASSLKEKDLLTRRDSSLLNHPICIYRLIQGPGLNGRWSQMSIIKAHSQFIHDFRDIGARKFHGVHAS